MHWLAEVDGAIALSHASVVERRLEAGDRALQTGYLEAVATLPAFKRRGYGSMVVPARRRSTCSPGVELGALFDECPGFCLSLGWEPWLGPTFVRSGRQGLERTKEDDGGDLRPAHAVHFGVVVGRSAGLRLALPATL